MPCCLLSSRLFFPGGDVLSRIVLPQDRLNLRSCLEWQNICYSGTYYSAVSACVPIARLSAHPSDGRQNCRGSLK